ncbi:MAG TPA: tripartite tricarboxylate transporter substrate binding protein [Burkholderiales bacterium]|nr:tripartite tricarboxylate transporter substrate binding protein [Burkholderiales bacterium]
MAVRTLALATCLAAMLAGPGSASAQDYPTKSIRFISPFPAGASQLLAHVVAERLTEGLGQPVVVDYKSGAGGNLGAELAAKAPPDGYTIVMLTPAHTISPSLYRKLGYDTMRDFVGISQLANVPNVLGVHPSLPARNLKELAQLARAHPGKLSFGSGGVGASNHLASELFKSLAKVDIVHVPYKGASIALTHILGGEVEMVIVTMPATIPFIESGRLRGIALLAHERSPQLPKLPTTAEEGMPDLVMNTWYGVAAPAGVRPEIIKRINAEIVKGLQIPEVKQRLEKVGVDPATSTPEQFHELLKTERVKWARVIKEAKISVE